MNVNTIVLLISREVLTSSLTTYGFPFRIIKSGTISWGILDLWYLSKVTLKHESINNMTTVEKGKFSATAL